MVVERPRQCEEERMAMPTITALYAGILGLMSVAIAFQAGRLRGSTKISIGDGGNRELLLAMRRHANFIEFVPLGLVLIALVEMSGANALAIHALGGGLVAFRICHAVGLKADTIESVGRAAGAAGSTLVIVVASIWAIISFF
jgi:uncharacterized membrane protein YecN with MAPEG domain